MTDAHISIGEGGALILTGWDRRRIKMVYALMQRNYLADKDLNESLSFDLGPEWGVKTTEMRRGRVDDSDVARYFEEVRRP